MALTKKIKYLYSIVAALLMLVMEANAQPPGILRNLGNRVNNTGQGSGQNGDSLRIRNKSEDSITIFHYYIDSSRKYQFDSSVTNLSDKYLVPPNDIYLGNIGTATRPVLFSPRMKDGWDYGFHAFDAYRFSVEKARFFNTTRPFTELGYTIGSNTQQIIEVIHTQNVRPSLNISFQYRQINSPGFLKNELAVHNSLQFTSWYQAPGKRYNNYIILLSNKSNVNENGGIASDKNYLFDTLYKSSRFAIPVNLGNDVAYGRNFFSSKLSVGNSYKQSVYFMRQQYDFGRKDSLVTDSTVIPLFFPRLRLEHSISIEQSNFLFQDLPVSGHMPKTTDSAFIFNAYHIIVPSDSQGLRRNDIWKEFNTDFSIYTFPDAKNLQQYLKLGASYQHLSGIVKTRTASYYNLFVHGEYRNRTKNQKWDMQAYGNLYLNGYNSGDYHGYVSLQRLLGKKIGSLQLGFENVNRSPSYNFDSSSSFYLDTTYRKFGKENTTHVFARYYEPVLKLQLTGDYFLVSNYLYISNYFRLQQESGIFTVLRLGALKSFHLSRNLNLHSELYLQQQTGNPAVHFPSLYTRNRIAYEGVFFKNLNLSTGIEIKYQSPYKADSYSPLLGQFFYQDSITIQNRPEVNLFLNFRIRTFNAFIRLENLNSANFANGFSFSANNLAAPYYPMPGMLFRLGIHWTFIN